MFPYQISCYFSLNLVKCLLHSIVVNPEFCLLAVCAVAEVACAHKRRCTVCHSSNHFCRHHHHCCTTTMLRGKQVRPSRSTHTSCLYHHETLATIRNFLIFSIRTGQITSDSRHTAGVTTDKKFRKKGKSRATAGTQQG